MSAAVTGVTFWSLKFPYIWDFLPCTVSFYLLKIKYFQIQECWNKKPLIRDSVDKVMTIEKAEPVVFTPFTPAAK